MLRLFLVIIYFGLGVPALAAAQQDQNDLRALAAFIENRWSDDEPGGAVIIIQHGDIIYETYKGLSDLTTQAPISADTVFPYASITKRFTAATILSLAEAGLVELDAPIKTYLPLSDGPMAAITVRQLLTHSSGIPSNFDADFSHDYSTEEHVQKIANLDLSFTPGSTSRYSNNGYNLLGAIIEAVTKKNWYQAVIERTVEPNQWPSINYLQTHIEADSKLATGYWEKMLSYPPAPEKSPGLLHANGSLAGTLRDLANWTYAFQRGKIISPKSLQTALEKRPTSDGKPGWGMGLFRFNYRDREVISHAGGANGINTYSLYLPHLDIVVAVATNVPQDASDLTFGIVDCLIGHICRTFKAQPTDIQKLQPILGTYRYSDGTKERLFLEDGALFMQYEQQRPLRLLSAGDNRFFVKRRRHWLAISKLDDGKLALAFHERGAAEANIAVKE